MKKIHIYSSPQIKPGNFIFEGHYDFTKTDSGLPAMRVVWKTRKLMGAFFSSEDGIFVFAEGATKACPVDDEISQRLARHLKPSAYVGGGLVGGAVKLGTYLIREARDLSGTKGFAFTYTNNSGLGGFCWAIAPAEWVDEILASVPADRIDLSIAPRLSK